MAKVGQETVRHIARLAQLDLSEDRLLQFTDELGAILDHMASISDFDIEGGTDDAGPAPRRRADTPKSHEETHLIQAPTQDSEVTVPQVKDAS